MACAAHVCAAEGCHDLALFSCIFCKQGFCSIDYQIHRTEYNNAKSNTGACHPEIRLNDWHHQNYLTPFNV